MGNSKFRRAFIAVIAAAGAAVATPQITPAQANEPSAEVSTSDPSDSTPESIAAEAPGSPGPDESNVDPVAEFWTEDRMEEAVPLEAETDETGYEEGTEDAEETGAPEITESNGYTGPETTAEPVVQSSLQVASAVGADDGSTPSTQTAPRHSYATGRLFFINRRTGKSNWCSAAAVNSSSKRLVMTAGHCVHGGPNAPGNGFHTKVAFVPGYDDGRRPRGTFTAHWLRTYSDWMNYGSSGRGYNSDVAFITTNVNKNGRRVVPAVGGNGITIGGSYSIPVRIIGYPGNRSGGRLQYHCRGGTTSQYRIGVVNRYYFRRMDGCDFAGGASGGPWLDNYSETSGVGMIRGVSSFGPASGPPEYLGAAYLDDRLPGLYRNSNADW